MRRIRTVWLAALSAVSIGAGMAGCHGDSSKPREASDEVRSVRVIAAETGARPRTITATGTLAAEQQVVLGMKTAGRLSEVAVDLGSRVHKGDALARLTPVDFQLRVRQAQAALQQARSRLGLSPDDASARIDSEKTSIVRQARAVMNEAQMQLDRARELSKKNLTARSELDAAEANFKVAEGRYHDSLEEVLDRQGMMAQRQVELEIAQQQLTDSVIVAPFDGSVRERQATAGEFVTAGQSILTLVQTDPLRLRLSLPERVSGEVREGQDVQVTVTGDQTTYPARVARISPAIDEKSRTLMVEASVPNPNDRLRPGAFATAEIVTVADDPVVLVPASALVTFAGIEKVLIVKEDKAVEKRVRTGRREGEQIEIVEGLKPGEEVVVEPGNLVGGQKVSVSKS